MRRANRGTIWRRIWYERTSIVKCWYTIKLALRCKYNDLRLVKTWIEITRTVKRCTIPSRTHRPRGLNKVWSMERNGQPKRFCSVRSYHAGQHIRGLYRPISTRVSGQIGIVMFISAPKVTSFGIAPSRVALVLFANKFSVEFGFRQTTQ